METRSLMRSFVAQRASLSFAIVGVAGLIVSFTSAPLDACSAAAQVWSPFVLVSGLLLVGLVADDDGLFAAAGHWMARIAPSGVALFIGVTLLVGAVTSVLNLDTSVAFLTPVLVYAARSHGEAEAPLLYGSLLLSNAGSLFLPGSNLTNLIVLGHLHLTGREFFSHAWLSALGALAVTAVVIGIFERRSLVARIDDPMPAGRPSIGLGFAAVLCSAFLVILLHSPAIPVAVLGVVTFATHALTSPYAALLHPRSDENGEEAGLRSSPYAASLHPRSHENGEEAGLRSRKSGLARGADIVGGPVLIGLFGVAVALGTLGRVWSGPSTLLTHLDPWSTAAVAAVASLLVNNLPAASLLAASVPPHPFALLIGLNLGPNMFVTGSLAWFLWLRSARTAGARPSIRKASRIGMVSAPLSMGVALVLLTVSGTR